MSITRNLLAASAAILLSVSSVSALGVRIAGGDVNAGIPSNNDFGVTLAGLGVDTLAEGLFDGTTTLPGPALSFTLNGAPAARLTFTSEFAESAFQNRFSFDGGTIVETNGSGLGGPVAPVQSFTRTVFGPSLTSLFDNAFESDTDVPNDGIYDESWTTNDTAFGVFYNAADNASGDGLTTFWLALDDGNRIRDDNHDDLIIRVDVTAVPLPAAAWLLLAASGGLIAAKRRRAAKA